LVGKPDGKSLPGRPRSRWENSIKIDLIEIGWKFIWLRIIWNRGELL
jgi:hypothetical protein